MPTLAQPDSDLNIKLRHEKARFERPAPLGAIDEPTKWTLRCMHVDCNWVVEGLETELAARTGGLLHHEDTGHPVRLFAVVEFRCDVIRSQVWGR